MLAEFHMLTSRVPIGFIAAAKTHVNELGSYRVHCSSKENPDSILLNFDAPIGAPVTQLNPADVQRADRRVNIE